MPRYLSLALRSGFLTPRGGWWPHQWGLKGKGTGASSFSVDSRAGGCPHAFYTPLTSLQPPPIPSSAALLTLMLAFRVAPMNEPQEQVAELREENARLREANHHGRRQYLVVLGKLARRQKKLLKTAL